MPHRITCSRVQRSLFLSGALLAAALAQAQNINVTAANASNPAIYTVNFNSNPPSIHIENTDTSGLHSRSLVFTTNGTNNQVDLLLADNVDGTLLRYCGNFNPDKSQNANTSGDVVWTKTQGGPTNPDGLSVDSAGNLFLINQGSGTSTNPQVWVIQGLETNCQAVPPKTPGPITMIDGGKSFVAKQTLEETLIVKSPIFLTGPNAAVPQLNPGDLLVLTSNPARVVLYQGSGGLGPIPTNKNFPPKPIILLNENNFPAGTQPGGFDFLPTDNSLLVTTSTGTIFKFTVDQIVPTTGMPTTPPFATNLGNGQFKVRTGQQGGNVFAFVANNNGGDIFEFDASGTLLSTVTSGVQHPQGLAVTNSGYQPFANCAQTCDVLGDGPIGPNGQGTPLLTHTVSAPAVAGNIVENMCVVATDPRIAQCGSCTNAAIGACNANLVADPAKYKKDGGLRVSDVCGAGFDNGNPQTQTPGTLIIPNSMCGASGANSNGFTLVKTLTSAYGGAGFPFNGTYIETDSDFTGLPADANDLACATAPFQTAGWAPLFGEGVNPGGQYVLDVVNGCATPHSGGGTLSLWVLGTTLNTDVTGGLAGFAATEYNTLLATVMAETTSGALTPPLAANFTLQQCINESQAAFAKGSAYYAGAAQELLVADYNVFNNALSPPFNPSKNYPNPSGLLRALIETTRFTVGVRLDSEAEQRPPTFPIPNPQPPPPGTFPAAPPAPPLPTITGTPSPIGSNGQQYTYSPMTFDFTGINTATLTYSLTGPSWATLSITTNNQVVVSGKAKKAGSPFAFTLTVTDGCGATVQKVWTVTVS